MYFQAHAEKPRNTGGKKRKTAASTSTGKKRKTAASTSTMEEEEEEEEPIGDPPLNDHLPKVGWEFYIQPSPQSVLMCLVGRALARYRGGGSRGKKLC